MNNVENVAWAICKQANYSFTDEKRREEFEGHKPYYIDQAHAAIDAIAESNVLAVRGSHDAPGFDACVKAEAASLKQEPSQPDGMSIAKSALNALQAHHKWHQEIGEVIFPDDETKTTIDLSDGYVDSKLCEDTVNAINLLTPCHICGQPPYALGSPICSAVHACQPVRESGLHGYEISGNTIYIGPMRPDRVKVADITCTIDWDETYTEEAKQRRIRDAERICRGLDRE